MTIYTPPHLDALKPYKPGRPVQSVAREKKLDRIVKLASNENPLGPSPKALKAMQAEVADLHRYPEASSYDLVQALAATYDKPAEEIVCASGADSILSYILMAFSKEGDDILTAENAFFAFRIAAKKLGRTVRCVPQQNYRFDLEALAAAVREDTRMIYIPNPDNPTGSMVTKDELSKFMQTVPSTALVVLDEAYFDFARQNPDYPNGLDYQYDNLIVVRTFSKTAGLAGARVGFAWAREDVITEFLKVKLPFEPSNIGQVGALAFLDDHEFLSATVDINSRMLDMMRRFFDGVGQRYVPTAANFLMLLFDSEQQAFEFNQSCLNQGLILRYLKPMGYPNAVRINSGNEDETQFAIDVISRVLK